VNQQDYQYQLETDIELGGAAVRLLTAVVDQARKDLRNKSATGAQKRSAQVFLEWARKELPQ